MKLHLMYVFKISNFTHEVQFTHYEESYTEPVDFQL